MTAATSTALLEVVDVHRRFGGVHALRGATLSIKHGGTVHALVGENGSGKSTMLKALAGQLQPDAGTIRLDGEEVEFTHPTVALRRGIVTVTQETTLAPDLSIAENIFMGHRMERGRLGIRWGATSRRAGEVLDRLHLELDPNQIVRRLRPDQQQMVEIARAISMDARVLILDEATSSLTDDEVESLFAIVRRLREDGVATVFVSHRLSETFSLADEVTILRDGSTVEAGPLEDYDRRSLLTAMVGREHEDPPVRPEFRSSESALLSLRGVSVPGAVEGIDLDVEPGEIVGLAGLVGAGRSELLGAVFGLYPDRSGEIRLAGESIRVRSPREAVDHGIGFVPADRKGQGLVLTMSVRENLIMAASCNRPRMLRPSSSAELPVVDHALATMRIRAASPNAVIGTLSGGNQQKVALGKWLAAESRVLLLDEPTRGVDVGAKTEIYRLLGDAADSGIGILVSSSEVPELLAICDRIVVMFRGRVMATLGREEATEAAITRYGTGHE
jgi:ABC-type sugar transport system ATPase subunit